MKKTFIILLIVIIYSSFYPNFVHAISKTQLAEISKIENELFGYDYANENVSSRLSRLEISIYGKNNNGTPDNRLKKISSDINSEQIGKEIPPTEDTFLVDDSIQDNSVNYPIVDEIEKKLFNQMYKNRDFHTRIVTIERKLFGKIYDVDDYVTRLDRIKAEVMPERLAEEKVFGEGRGYDYSSGSLSSADIGGTSFSRYSTMPYGQENYTRPYANYGDFGGSSTGFASNENFENELAKLEYETFGTEFSNENPQKRMKRLESVHKAQKSSHKYDSQQFNNRMSTFMEIGSILLMILAMVL